MCCLKPTGPKPVGGSFGAEIKGGLLASGASLCAKQTATGHPVATQVRVLSAPLACAEVVGMQLTTSIGILPCPLAIDNRNRQSKISA
jgi:hypothetical protein